jgi:hypothetical protein
MPDAGLKELAGLESLEYLRLGGTKVTDAGLKELAGLQSLKDLGLSRTGVSGFRDPRPEIGDHGGIYALDCLLPCSFRLGTG